MDQSTQQQQMINGSADHQPQVLPSDHKQKRVLESFWADQMKEAEQTTDFKNCTLPLARVKKIMKAEEDVKMIASEAPMILAKASEMFISELTLRAWMHTEENKRKTLQKNDIAAAVSKTDMFDFLVDIVPRNDDPVSYYYVPAAAGQQYAAAGGPSGTAFYGDHICSAPPK